MLLQIILVDDIKLSVSRSDFTIGTYTLHKLETIYGDSHRQLEINLKLSSLNVESVVEYSNLKAES